MILKVIDQRWETRNTYSFIKEYSKLKIIYQNTASSGHEITLNTKYLIPNTIFYLSGPPKMVDNFEKMLLNLGVNQTDIRYDRFDGY